MTTHTSMRYCIKNGRSRGRRKCPLLAHGGPLAQLTVRAVPEADLAYCQVSVFTGSRSARLGISIIEY